MASAADACALCCLQFTGAFILCCYLVQIGLWSWAFHEMYTAMPKTFAWEKLLRTYGAHYDDCVDRSGSFEIVMKPWSLCPNNYTMPCVPVIAIILTIINFFCGTSCISRPKSQKMYTMVASSTTWQFIFTIIALAFTSYYFHNDIRALEREMERDLSKASAVSSRWQLTQIIHKCCGLKNGPFDWKNLGNLSDFPESCYPSQQRNNDTRAVFKQPCFSKEYSTVKFWAAFEIGLLASGLITAIFFLCLATAIHGGSRGNLNSAGRRSANAATADVFFVTSSNHRHGHFQHRLSPNNKANLPIEDSGGFHVHPQQGMESALMSRAESGGDQRLVNKN